MDRSLNGSFAPRKFSFSRSFAQRINRSTDLSLIRSFAQCIFHKRCISSDTGTNDQGHWCRCCMQYPFKQSKVMPPCHHYKTSSLLHHGQEEGGGARTKQKKRCYQSYTYSFLPVCANFSKFALDFARLNLVLNPFSTAKK